MEKGLWSDAPQPQDRQIPRYPGPLRVFERSREPTPGNPSVHPSASMTEPATRTDTPAGTETEFGSAPPGSRGGSARLRVAGMPLDLEHEQARPRRPCPPAEPGQRTDPRPRARARRADRLAAGARLRRDPRRDLHRARAEGAGPRRLRLRRRSCTRRSTTSAFVFLVTALLFARSGLYSRREARPGIRGDRRRPLLGGVRVARVRARERPRLQLLLHLLRRPVLRADLGSSLRWALRARHRRCAAALGRRRRAILVGSGKQIDAVAHALVGGGTGTGTSRSATSR